MGASQSQLGSPGRVGPPMDGPQGQAGVSCLSWPGSGGVPSAASQTLRAQSVPYWSPLLHMPSVQLLRKSGASGPTSTRVWTPETHPECSLLTASGPTPV